MCYTCEARRDKLLGTFYFYCDSIPLELRIMHLPHYPILLWLVLDKCVVNCNCFSNLGAILSLMVARGSRIQQAVLEVLHRIVAPADLLLSLPQPHGMPTN